MKKTKNKLLIISGIINFLYWYYPVYVHFNRNSIFSYEPYYIWENFLFIPSLVFEGIGIVSFTAAFVFINVGFIVSWIISYFLFKDVIIDRHFNKKKKRK